MSIKVSYNQQLISLLNSIFYESEDESDEFLPVIKDMENIPNIIPLININPKDEMNVENAISLIFFLKNIFSENNELIPVFLKHCKYNKTSFLESLINLYLKDQMEKQSLIMLEDFMFNINYTVSINKDIFEFIYQKLIIYFNINQKAKNENTQILNEALLLKYLKLLNIFYTDLKTQNKITEENGKKNKNNEDKVIRNYFYFNGMNSGIILTLNKTSNNLNIDSPTLLEGCTLIFYAYIDKELLDKYFESYLATSNKNITLIKMIFNSHIISLELKNSNNISVIIDDNESNIINVANSLKSHMWNCITFIIEPKSKKKGFIKILINGTTFSSSIYLPKNYDSKEKLDTIILFDNLIGKVTSIIYFSFLIEDKLLSFFNTELYGGFYKNKVLLKFLNSIDQDYWKNTKNINEKYKQDKNIVKLYNISIGLKDINKNKIISILCPYMYNNNTNIIDDAFGVFNGKFKSFYDGVNIYNNNLKNIVKLGGINNLLPISELMLNSLKKENYYFIDKNLLTESTLLEYLKIIKQILSYHRESIIELNNNYFFSSLCLFLEKYPSKIFTEKILNILLDICKETFRYKEDKVTNSKMQKISLNYKFISIILFNEKIIQKFSYENQLKIWEGIYDLFKLDNNLIKDALDFPKIINLLRFYDQNRYQKYCCKKHASLFGYNSEQEIMNPEINSRIGKLYDIIQLYINKVDIDKERINLYELLSLDISSCLKNEILKIYILHFINDKISDKIKEKTFNNLLGNNYFEITEYALSIALLDVRIEIFKLLHIFLIKYKDKIIDYLKKSSLNINQIFYYISNNILPIYIKINTDENQKNENPIKRCSTGNYNINVFYKDHLFGKNEKKNYLCYYFNAELYGNDINILWGLLNSWLTENASKDTAESRFILSKSVSLKRKEQNKENNELKTRSEDKNFLLINPFVLSFCIDFVCNTNPYFIDSFLSSINNFLSLQVIQNKNVFIKEQKFFYWLIDTIFFYHNKENEDMIEEKSLITSIQKNSLEILCQIFKLKTTLKEIENKLYYIMEYSFYFKTKFVNNNNTFLKEIVRITRLLFEELLKCSDLFFNIKSIFCFEFMFLYRNNEEVLSNYSHVNRRNSLLDNESLKKTLKKAKDELDIRKKNERNSVDIDSYDNYAINTESNSVITHTIINNSNIITNTNNNEIDLIPNYYYQGMYSILHNHSNNQKKILKNIWTDYEIYSYIINYYRNNFWGPESIFKTVKLVYHSEKGIFESCQTLLNYFGENRDYRNVLFKKIYKLSIIDDDFQNGINKINLLYLNLILLCFSIDVSGVLDEQEEITQKLIEFLIFCILASININQIEDTYNYIQKKLYYAISFGLLFLKDKDEVKYRELMFYMIEPFFEGVGPKKIFGSKKSLYKNSAIYKVFIKSEQDNIERRATKIYDDTPKKGMSSSLPKNSVVYNKGSKGSFVKSKLCIKKKNKIMFFIRANAQQISKNLFLRVINFYKEKKYLFNKENYIMLFYYKYENDINDNNNKNNNKNNTKKSNIIELEKKRINMLMKKMIPNLLSEIKKKSISYYLEEKKRRNIFKKTKKTLFSWNGFWSDKNLFLSHPEYLKFRIKNHYCQDMSRILLSPILDVQYYLPNFSKFDINNLFNKDDIKYYICMDVDEILKISDEDEIQNNNNNEQCIKNNKYNLNYLVYLYKNQYNNIWDIYYANLVEELNADKLGNNSKTPKEVFELLFQNKLNSINEENVQNENIYNCCIVKPTHHIKGYISTEKGSITFTYCPDNESKELLEKDPSYDKDMGACFGSTFKMYYKDKDKFGLEIKYKSIEYMFKKNYFYQETGLEILTYEKKSYFINFKSNQELLKFINDIIQHEKFRAIKCYGHKGKKLIGYCKLFNVYTKKSSYYINNKIEEWQNNTISTFEYLMWLNIFAGRSFNDLTQYPIFPWIITNYQSEELNEKEDFRNLSIPVGMFDFNEKAEMRKETFIEFYNTLKNELKESKPDFDYEEFLEKNDAYIEHYNNKKVKNNENNESNSEQFQINQLPYFYGSHYSNPTYVSHYLTRLFPHASISIEIHGDKFDDPNRLFFSMNRTFETASTLKDDIRELIPEFYILPEIFLNNNNFNLSQNKLDSEGNQIVINEVELPPWSNYRCTNFIIEMRKNLEKNSLKINKWIDLIFGYLQKGKKAEENNNIFMSNTYENMVKLENIKDDDEKNALMRLFEVGVTPIQLLTSESRQKNDINQILAKSPYNNSKGAFLCESTELKCLKITMYKYQKLIKKINNDYKPNNDNNILPRIIKMKALPKNELRIFTNCNYWFNLKFGKNENKNAIEESSLIELFNISSKYAPSYLISTIQTPIIVFGNNRFIIKGGFWDGRIEINVINSDPKEEKDSINYSIYTEDGPIIVMTINKEENLLLCGTLYGCIIVYQIEYLNNNTNIQLNLINKIFDHINSINSISINDNLNMFATSGNDEYVYLYLLPTLEIFRSIRISSKKDSENELIFPSNTFLSNSPLPCISIFINSKKMFKSYTINGEYIAENQETDTSSEIKCFIIFNDLSFCDYLIYGTDDGMVKIRSFPEMNLINCCKPFDCCEILCLEISLDKRYCYAWSKGGELAIIRDISANDPIEVEQKKLKFK